MELRLLLLPLLVGTAAAAAVAATESEFVAGSFILTQKSLDEAPFRFAGVLRRALDRAETKEPPSRSDEENCDVRYRIRPSGKRSKLRIIEDTLSINLKENNTVVIAAKVYVEVAAKTWIWKGVSFGFLGCLKMNSCKGQTVTYSANVDCKVSFQVFWKDDEKRLSVNIKPVDTKLNDVNVNGCKPPWYLWWFKKWQSLLNQGVQEAFEEFANNYEHMAEVPEEFSPLEDVFVKYKITNMHWTRDYVLFQANATFATVVDGKNKTFVPHGRQNLVPMDLWNPISFSDRKSHLLQGIRLSTEFLNSLMWYASVTNVTKYYGAAKVLDSQINGTISYTPPVIRVEKDELLSIDIRHGLLLATCRPTDATKSSGDPETLFRAEFYELAGRGKIRLASSSDKTGITVSLDELDLSNMNTKPFEPKLPLPESFENELMKNAISQLQPVVNNYLRAKPLHLPDNLAPFAAAPELRLVETGGGLGYAELSNYCTCSSVETRAGFAVCDPRSHICDGGRRNEDDEEENNGSDESDEDGDGSLRDNVKNGLKNIFGFASGILNRDEDSGESRSFGDNDGNGQGNFINFTALFEESKRNPSYFGHHLTFFEDSLDCRLDEAGSAAKAYWLWETAECSPLFLHGEYLNQFYYMDASTIKFGCSDSSCKFCEYNSLEKPREEGQCFKTMLGQSYRLGHPNVDGWESSSGENASLVANVFFDRDSCAYYPRYVEPQMVSSHINVGARGVGACQETEGGEYINLVMENSTVVKAANWECSKDCFGCLFNLRNVEVGTCRSYEGKLRVLFSRTVQSSGEGSEGGVGDIIKSLVDDDEVKYIAVTCSILVAVFALGTIAICYKCKRSKSVNPSLRETSVSGTARGHGAKNVSTSAPPSCGARTKARLSSALKAITSRVGWRFSQWKKAEAKEIREDLVQNFLLILNAVMAVVFAVEWNSDNNPLLIIQNKFRNGVTVSVDILDTSRVEEFVDRLNHLTLAVNVANAVFSVGVVVLWCLSTAGSRTAWTKLRLLSSATLLAGIFVVFATVIFSTYFDELVTLERDGGIFLTDNASMHSIASSTLRITLNGFSLTVISFTIVFLFHGIGGGLYCGTVVFRLLHVHTKRSNMEILTTLLVILTIIQPFICLHPVIIWSQDSNHNSAFLVLVILIWFLPLGVHTLGKALITHCRPRCEKRLTPPSSAATQSYELEDQSGDGRRRSRREKEQQAEERRRCQERKSRSMLFFDIMLQISQLAFFLASFSLITHHIINTEFNQERKNLQDFILPAVTSVFFWMASVSYFLLALILDDSEGGAEKNRLVFKDQNLEAARDVLRKSLRRRLAVMDDRAERWRTIQRHKDLGLDSSFSLERSFDVRGGRRQRGRTLPPNIDLSESMRGRQVRPQDSSLVIVNSGARAKELFASDDDEVEVVDVKGNVRDRIKQFEKRRKRKTLRPAPPPPLPPKPPALLARKPRPSIERQRSRNADKYVLKQEVVDMVARAEGEMPEVETRRSNNNSSSGSKEEAEDSAEEEERRRKSVIVAGEWYPSGCWGQTRRFFDFLLERKEYKDPVTYGWRIKFRRLFLIIGVVLFTCLTIHTTVSSQEFSSKEEIQEILDYAGTNLTWPDSGSVLDDVFQLYNGMERTKSYIMIASTLLFWTSLTFDVASHLALTLHRKSLFFTGSRVTNFFGSLTVFAGVIVVGLPDYLSASRLDEICPFCGEDFNRTIRQVAEFSIGLFFACLFTFQLIPILATVVPALVRASVLILIHPSLHIEDVEGASLRMGILQQVIQFSSLLAFPITFISMAIVQQYMKDVLVTALIMAFWTVPPAVLMVGLHYTRKFRRYAILLYVYYAYNCCYFLILLGLLLYAMTPERIVDVMGDLMQEPTFWAGSVAQVFLCNVVISDMLYMTVF